MTTAMMKHYSIVYLIVFVLAPLQDCLGYDIAVYSFTNPDNKRQGFEEKKVCCCSKPCSESDCDETCQVAFTICWVYDSVSIQKCKTFDNLSINDTFKAKDPIEFNSQWPCLGTQSENPTGVLINILHEEDEAVRYPIDYINITLSSNMSTIKNNYTGEYKHVTVALAISTNEPSTTTISNTETSIIRTATVYHTSVSSSVSPSVSSCVDVCVSMTSSPVEMPCDLWTLLFAIVSVFSILLIAIFTLVCVATVCFFKSTRKSFTIPRNNESQSQTDNNTNQTEAIYDCIGDQTDFRSMNSTSALINSSAILPQISSIQLPTVNENDNDDDDDDNVECRYVDTENMGTRRPSFYEVPMRNRQPPPLTRNPSNYEIPVSRGSTL
jgi:hypothetical protein